MCPGSFELGKAGSDVIVAAVGGLLPRLPASGEGGMDRIESRIARYRAWYRIVRTLTFLQHAVFAGLCLLAACLLVEKTVYIGLSPVTYAAAACVAVLASGLVYFIFLRADRYVVGYSVDRAAGLKNLVCSGINAASETGETAAVVVERASSVLESESPPRLMPLRLARSGRLSIVPAAVAAAALLLPQMDLFKRADAASRKAAEQAVVKEGMLKLTASMAAIEKGSKATESVEDRQINRDFTVLAENLMGVSKSEALLKLGEFENKYRKEFSEQRNFENAAKTMSVEPNPEGLSKIDQEQLKKLKDGFNKGDMQQAADALKDLAKKLQDPDLSPEEKKALARELAKMADQMKGESNSQELSKLLKQIESSDGNLQELLQQCEKASQELQEMADFCKQCDESGKMQEGLADAKKEMLGDSFSGFDAKEVEQYMEQQAQAQMSQSGQGLGMGIPGECEGNGGAMGQRGHGRGGEALENMTDTAFKDENEKSKMNRGKILQEVFVTGTPEKGDAPVEYTEIVKAARQQAASSLARDRIPQEYEDMVKGYFDSLDKKELPPSGEE